MSPFRTASHLFSRIPPLVAGSARGCVFVTAAALALCASPSPARAQEPDGAAFEASPAPASAAPGGCASPGQVGRGFALQTGVGGRLLTLADPSAAAAAATMMTAGATGDFSAGLGWNLFAGYKICRVTVGLGLDLAVSSPAGSKNVTTQVLVTPEAQFALLRSADGRAELLGVINVGLGEVAGNFRIGGLIAPGMRYWLHRHIAVTSRVGVAGDLVVHNKGQGALLSLAGSVGVLGAF